MELDQRTKLVKTGGYEAPPNQRNGIIGLYVINSSLQVPIKTRTEQGWGNWESRQNSIELHGLIRYNRNNPKEEIESPKKNYTDEGAT